MQRLRIVFCLSSSIAFATFASFTLADNDPKPVASKQIIESKKPLHKGDLVGSFRVTKVAGAVEDGVEPGTELCYRCRYGSRPMVMVFARQTGGELPKLVEELDKAVDTNKEAQLRGLITLIGEDVAKVKEDANRVAEKSGAKSVAVVVAKENETGPTNYKLNQKAEVTVVVASDSLVVATHTFDVAKIDIATVIKEVKAMLN